MTEKTESAFNLRYAVRVEIDAPPEAVWHKLTDAEGFPKWNSTVESIRGPIALGQKLEIKVPVAPGRTFSPKVVAFEPNKKMVWQDGFFPMFQGTRTFTLESTAKGTVFEMVEVFRGAMLPMIKGSLPDFGPVFDRYARDLADACKKP